MTDAADIGARVLAGLAEGRARAIERRQAYSHFLEKLVAEQAGRDRGPDRGKAKRVARALRGFVTESGARKILRRLNLPGSPVGKVDDCTLKSPSPGDRTE